MLDQDNINSIIHAYRSGQTCVQIAEIFGVSKQRIQQILAKNGITRKDRPKVSKRQTYKRTCVVCSKSFEHKTNPNIQSCSEKCHSILKVKRNPSKILNEQDVIEILKLRKKGLMLKNIAKQFNVSIPTIWSIVNGRIWKHV